MNSRFGIRIDRLETAVRSSNQILFVGGPRSNPPAWKIEGSDLYTREQKLARARRTLLLRFTFSFSSFHQNFSILSPPPLKSFSNFLSILHYTRKQLVNRLYKRSKLIAPTFTRMVIRLLSGLRYIFTTKINLQD